MTGRVFDISRGCVDDGPGLRTTVFLKGCHLTCPWCHNFEGKSFRPEIAFDESICIGCKTCQQACSRTWSPDGWRIECTACGACAQACPSGARRLVGREITPDELVSEIAVDQDFFEGTGGGVTFSGGEPLSQPGFLFACASKIKKRGIHLAVETSGYWPARYVAKLERWFDLVLFDLKHVDLEKCRSELGTGSRDALYNLESILFSKLAVEVRITLVPGFNDSDDDLRQLAEFLRSAPRRPPVRLQPFHRLAASKQDLFDQVYPFAGLCPTGEERIMEAKELFADR
ncbi:MAG: glycyl-radical enzyme activating protein [Deltaproteobacteria bacterium]|nr:glycyl-radical enzyme activating protein [Deltaproteobacteria bacterium]